MIAKFLKHESHARRVVWNVYGGRGRRWTVTFFTATAEYVVTNEAGRDVKPSGRLGQAIINATKA